MSAVSIDRRAMARAFGAAANSYDAAAALQSDVRRELLERTRELRREPQVVIDLGAGTGGATAQLKTLYPHARVYAVDIAQPMLQRAAARIGWFDRHWPWSRRRYDCITADARRLPFADGTVDLVFSSLMLQWCDDLDVVLAEIRRVLSPRGLFIFSSLGPTTLIELREAWAAVDSHPHVNEFIDAHDLGSALSRAGLIEPVLDVDRMVRRYPDVMALLRSLQAIGARNALDQRNRGLTGRKSLGTLQRAYTALVGTEENVPATWEVVYGCCFGAADAHRATGVPGEFAIPLERIGRR